jgi:hypothetical protein
MKITASDKKKADKLLRSICRIKGEMRRAYKCGCGKIFANQFIPYGIGRGRSFNPCVCQLTQHMSNTGCKEVYPEHPKPRNIMSTITSIKSKDHVEPIKAKAWKHLHFSHCGNSYTGLATYDSEEEAGSRLKNWEETRDSYAGITCLNGPVRRADISYLPTADWHHALIIPWNH